MVLYIYHKGEEILKRNDAIATWALLKKQYRDKDHPKETLRCNVIKLRDDEPSRYYCLDGIFI